MSLIAIRINDRGFMRLKSNLDRISKQIPRVLARGLNEGGDRVRTVVQRQLRAQAQPTRYSSITSRVRTMRAFEAAAGGSVAYQIIVKGGGMGISEFPVHVTKGPGGGVDAKLWGVDRQFKRSFQIAGRAGFAGLRMRLTSDRFPLRSFKGPDLAKELIKPELAQVFYAAAAEFVPGMIVKRLSVLFGERRLMAALLEARAIITASDETAAAFASVQARIAELHGKIAGMNAQLGTAGRVTGAVGATSGAAISASASSLAAREAEGKAVRQRLQREADEAAAARMKPLKDTAETAGNAGVIAAGVALAEAVYGGLKEGVDQAHERIRQQAAGMNTKEVAEADALASELSKRYPAIAQSDMMHMARNARAIVGSYEEAAELMEPLARLRVVAQGANIKADPKELDEDFDKLVKGLEIKGVTQDKGKFKEYMEGVAKGLNAFGDTLKPYQYYEMFKYGRQATPVLSERFMLGTAPSLAQELGGSSYGKAVSAFNAELVNNVMKQSAAKSLANLGLINPSDLDYTKSGEVKGVLPGHHIQGWALAQTDPNEWVKQYLLPAIAKKGITDKGEISQTIGTLFGNQMASQLVNILATQQTRIDKDLAMLEHAGGLATSHDFATKDPIVAGKGLWNTIENAFSGLAPGERAASFMANLSQAISWARSPSTYQDPNPSKYGFNQWGRLMTPNWQLEDHPEWGRHPYASPSSWIDPTEINRAYAAQASLHQGADMEARRGSALGGLSGKPIDVTGFVKLDPNSKADVAITIRVEDGPIIKLIHDEIAKATGSLIATVGRMNGAAAPASRVGGIGHQ